MSVMILCSMVVYVMIMSSLHKHHDLLNYNPKTVDKLNYITLVLHGVSMSIVVSYMLMTYYKSWFMLMVLIVTFYLMYGGSLNIRNFIEPFVIKNNFRKQVIIYNIIIVGGMIICAL